MRELKIGIAGCGRMGKERARCAAASGAKVTATFDIDASRSAELAARYNAATLTRADELFRLGLDAVFVCIAPGARGSLEDNCIEAGLPFYVEKPVGISGERGHEILLRLRKKPVVHGVGYMNRYRRSIQLAKAILENASIVGFSAHWVCRRYGVPWWELAGQSGGPHNEQATHAFDLVRFLVGEVHAVKSIFRDSSRVSTSVECANGALGTVFYSCDGSDKDIGLRIFTNKGSLALCGWDFRLSENTIDGQLSEGGNEDVFLLESETFLDAVRNRDQRLLQSDMADALKTQSVMDAARYSSETRSFHVAAENGAHFASNQTLDRLASRSTK